MKLSLAIKRDVFEDFFKAFVKHVNHIELSKEDKYVVQQIDNLWKTHGLCIQGAINQQEDSYSLSIYDKSEIVSIYGNPLLGNTHIKLGGHN